MSKYGNNKQQDKGFKGTSTGLPDDNSRKWMPGVLFQPQETSARNAANCKPIEPTSSYAKDDMPVFRPFGANDED